MFSVYWQTNIYLFFFKIVMGPGMGPNATSLHALPSLILNYDKTVFQTDHFQVPHSY